MSKPVRLPPPDALKEPGKGLWQRVHEDLADNLELSATEYELLRRACAAADREAALQAVIDEKGYLIPGSKDQDVLNPAVGELRLVEAQLARLLSQIDMDDNGSKAPTMSQQRASKAANVRWMGHREREAQRAELAGG